MIANLNRTMTKKKKKRVSISGVTTFVPPAADKEIGTPISQISFLNSSFY